MCFALKNASLDIEWTISCEKNQICCFTISPVLWYVLCKSFSRKFVKDFVGCRSGANRSFGFGGQRSDGATCIIYCISVWNKVATNQNIFSLPEQIKSMHSILMFSGTICGVFSLMERNKSYGNIIWSLFFSRCRAFLSS